jgi:hypothetical protein
MKGSLDFILDYLCDDPNDNNDPGIEVAKKALRRLQDSFHPGDSEKLRIIGSWFKQMPQLDEPWVREVLTRMQTVSSEIEGEL